jgi:hypothetical protein
LFHRATCIPRIEKIEDLLPGTEIKVFPPNFFSNLVSFGFVQNKLKSEMGINPESINLALSHIYDNWVYHS